MKIFLLAFLSLIPPICLAQNNSGPTIQNALDTYDFIQEQFITDNDTITYYLKNSRVKPNNLVVYIQGTDANPIFSNSVKEGKTIYYRWFGEEYKHLDSTYTYAIIPKPGMAGLYKDGEIAVPKRYYEKNHLDYRIKQIDVSIDHIIENHLSEPKKIVVYGHSEGAAIGAALGSTAPTSSSVILKVAVLGVQSLSLAVMATSAVAKLPTCAVADTESTI